jgi:hypothetical protein|tara:strand:- start:2436 stop:2723 length:288 start_codon:yes stop_codon:yes gene_type:complete
MRDIPRKQRGKRNQFFDADGVDEMLSGLLRLTAEVSAVKDRLYIMERVLESQGLSVSEAVESYMTTSEDDQALTDQRHRLIETVLAQLDASADTE